MSSKRYLPQVPSQTTMTKTTTANAATNQPPFTSRSAIEDLFDVFENNPEFITMSKRLLNKKRKLEQLRAQLNLPDQLTNEDTVKLLKLRERLKAKRRLRKILRAQTIDHMLPLVFLFSLSLSLPATISIDSELSPTWNPSGMIQRHPSSSMPDLSKVVTYVTIDPLF